ncbi:DNA replication ATP-dependent helicase/nuclease DNA2 isoform X2 [Daktulosphaira vitifoliae]|uniref:DNA replication ATP-dependent helicase/nuclease DNA2 isoform X2 n=1 Tax=Daktulosphaira vitifoliae TaxID=58002 RepID=UPI0021AA5BB8|nr:DNA replication ATP-dependent helicase/nuclease DNA2 isoform X2 [Daktulosphaira vitifoliae]
MKRTCSKVQKAESSSSKQIKITSLFSHSSNVMNSIILHKNCDDDVVNKKQLSPESQKLSSPDIVPPSPVLLKKKVIKAKRSLNKILSNNIVNDKIKSPNIGTHTKKDLNLSIKNVDNSQEECIDTDYQSFTGTESIASTIDDVDFCSELFLDDWITSSLPTFKNLDLSKPRRCTVTKIEKKPPIIYLTLNCCINSEEQSLCALSGVWFNSSFDVGDIVTVMAEKCTDVWSINNDIGFVTRHSDFLVSGTTIVGSLFCTRRSVLTDIYKGLDCTPAIMVTGTLLHQLLQTVLKSKMFHSSHITALINEITNSSGFIHTLYESNMELDKTKKELMEFIPKIQNFVGTYITDFKTGRGKKTWQGEILSVQDIEENLWVPEFGVKGKVDVTVQAKYSGSIKTMPIELKTGRASGSEEHRGQVILYVIMMAQLGMDVDSGLLLYLRENILTHVKVGHKEKRDLIMLRNHLVHYLKSNKIVSKSINEYLPILPEPINHHNACSKCPYLTMCSSVLSKEGFETLTENNPLRNLAPQAISHLKPVHIDYVMQWTAFLQLENYTDANDTLIAKTSDIWTLPVDEREKRGHCIASLKISSDVKEQGDKYYIHTMEKLDKKKKNNFKLTDFSVGSYSVVSTNERTAVATGYISFLSESTVDILLDSLALLLETSDSSDQLRRFIIDKELPSFVSFNRNLNDFVKSTGLTDNLNHSQYSAIIKALAAEHFALIKGMPGTGKTSTVAILIELLVLMGRSVLVTSHTHSAVDNLLLLLNKKGIDFLRLGSKRRVHPNLISKCDEIATQHCDTPEKLSTFYNQMKVVGVTCLGCGHALLQKRTFDVCIVDEATQVVQSSVIAALHSSKTFILIGDPQQLPPLIKNKKAKELGMDISLFERLDRPSVTAILNVQYRMNGSIVELANNYAYNGSLKCANDDIKNATLNLKKCNVNSKWLEAVLSSDLNKSVLLLDTEILKNQSTESDSNIIEVKIINKLVLLLIQCGILGLSIGIIAPYRAQVALLKNTLCNIDPDIEVNTVDQYQGRDKEVIIYSCTKNNFTKDIGILSDKRRITVAITRAKKKLIIIGNINVMKSYDTFHSLFNNITNVIKLPQDCAD